MSAQYALLEVLRNQVPGSTEYKIPIIAIQDLYNRIENLDTETRLIIKEGRSAGYPDITSFYQEVCQSIGLNPFMLKKKFYINTNGLSYGDGIEVKLIEAFGGEYEEWNRNQANFYPRVETGANLIGGTAFAAGSSTSQASVGQTPYGTGGEVQLFNNIIRPKLHDSFTGIEYMFEVWPEAAISHKYIDSQHFFRDNGLIKSCHIHIEVWYNDTDQTYHYTVYLSTFYFPQSTTDLIDTNLNQAELDKVYNPDNPFDNKQGDGDQGGNEESDDDSDPVAVPDLPSLDISDLGGVNIYKVSAQQVTALFAFLQTTEPTAAILKWITNPIQGIISLHILPYPILGKGADIIRILGLPIANTSATLVKQFQEWNLGGVLVPYGFDNTFLDYEPYSKCSIYLPFIGIRPLDMDEVVGQSVNVTYQFDNVSGACIAFVTVNGAVRYSFTGSCAVGIPINQQNWGQTYIAAAMSAAGALAGGIGGAVSAVGNGAGKLGAVVGGVAGAIQGSGGIGALDKPTISRSGSISGAGAALGVPYPYIIIERPTKASAANPAPVTGLVSGRTLPLGSLSGYNIIEHVHLHGIAATGEELQEIERLLYEGVVF